LTWYSEGEWKCIIAEGDDGVGGRLETLSHKPTNFRNQSEIKESASG